MKPLWRAVLIPLLAAPQTQATFWGSDQYFPAPPRCDNECSDLQQNGFDWSELDFGEMSRFGEFDFSGFECKESFDLKTWTGKFQEKCIVAQLSNEASFDHPGFSQNGQKGFSINSTQISTEFETEVTFVYTMPDSSTCKETHPCSPDGTVVTNKQCGGATSVNFLLPKFSAEKESKFAIHFIDFGCGPPEYPTPDYPIPDYPVPTGTSVPSDTSTDELPPTQSSTGEAPTSATLPPGYDTTSIVIPSSLPSSTLLTPSSSFTLPPIPTQPTFTPPVSNTTTFIYPTAPPATTSPQSMTTSTIFTTSLITFTSCAPDVPDCPAQSQTPTVITSTIAISTTVCPITETPTGPIPTPPVPTEPEPGLPDTTEPEYPPTPPVPTPPVPTEPESEYPPTPPVPTPPVPTEPESEYPPTPPVPTPPVPTEPEPSLPDTTVTEPESPPTPPVPTEPEPEYPPTPPVPTPPVPTEPVPTGPLPTDSTSIPTEPAPGLPGTTSGGTGTTVNPPIPSNPAPSTPCPDVVPKCLNTWLGMIPECESNSDIRCFCPSSEFTSAVIQCIQSWGASDEEIQSALSYFTGICAAHIPENPGIITAIPTTITVGPTAPPVTITGAGPTETVTEPCTTITVSQVVTISDTLTSTLTSAITVPQVGFTTSTPTGPGETPTVGLIPGPAPVTATPPAFPPTFGPSTLSTLSATPSGALPSSSETIPPYDGAASSLSSTSAGWLLALTIFVVGFLE